MTIGFASWEYERSIYEPLIAEFNAENPDIRVQFVSIDELSFEEYNDHTRMILSNADTASLGYLQPEQIDAGFFFDLRPLMDADASFETADFYPGALEAYARGEGLYLLPRRLYVQTLSYNKTLFESEGLARPEPSQSWSDLLALAEQLTDGSGSRVDRYGLMEPSGGFLPFSGLLHDQNIGLFTVPAADVRLDTPEIIDTLDRLTGLAEDGVLWLPPTDPQGQYPDTNTMIREGQVAIWGSDMFYADPEADPLPFEVGRLPFPELEPGLFTTSAEGLVISSGTQYPEQAWRWIEFVSRQDLVYPDGSPAITSGQINQIPARISVAERMGFWEGIDQETAEILTYVLENQPALPERTPDYLVPGVIYNYVNQVITGQKRSDTAMREAQVELENQIAQVELTPRPTPDTSPIVVATPGSDVAPPGALAITFGSSGMSPGEIRRMAREFMEQRPDIFVRVQNTDTFTDTTSLSNLAQRVDCFNSWLIPSEQDTAALLDLRPLFDASTDFEIADYAPALLSPFEQQGGLYGLPVAVNFRILMYNRTAFDAAGLGYPNADWTLNDFLAAAQALTKGEGDQRQYGFASPGNQLGDLLFFLSQYDAIPTRGQGEQIQPSYTEPELIEALRFYVDLVRTYQVSPQTNLEGYRSDGSWTDTWQLLSSGRIGMWFDYGYGYPITGPDGQPADFVIATAPLPVGDAGLSTADLNLRGMYISRNAAEPEACWDFLKYLSGEVSLLQGGIPARYSLAESDEYLATADPMAVEIFDAYRPALERPANNNLRPDQFWNGRIDYFWFFQAVDRAMQGEDLERELAEAQRITEEYLDCLSGGAEPYVCNVQVDPEYKGFNTPPDEGGPRPID